MKEIPMAKAYDPAEVEAKWYEVWVEQGYFHASAATATPPRTIGHMGAIVRTDTRPGKFWRVCVLSARE